MKRTLWNILAVACLGLGTVGIFVPGMPTTIFYIIALYGFTIGGNEKARQKLLDHPRFGPGLRQWETTKAISARIKWISCSSIVVMSTVSSVIIRRPIAIAGVWVIALIGLAYILSRPTFRAVDAPVIEPTEPRQLVS